MGTKGRVADELLSGGDSGGREIQGQQLSDIAVDIGIQDVLSGNRIRVKRLAEFLPVGCPIDP